jgi:CheY-like chemotaxis protein
MNWVIPYAFSQSFQESIMKQVVLFADNNDEICNVWGRNLKKAGYKVEFAKSPEEASKKLKEGDIDLAVLDVRLTDDNDTHDTSGITIAADLAFRHIPKIMLTGFKPSPENIRKLQELSAVELPSAVTWVDKGERPEKLLKIIPQVISLWPRLQQVQILAGKISRQLEDDQSTIRLHVSQGYRRTIDSSYIGYSLIVAGILLALFKIVEISIVVAIGGIITEVLSYLFFQRLDVANERMDKYHRELLQTYWLELLLATCEPLPAESQIATSEYIIKAATNSWFSIKSDPQ